MGSAPREGLSRRHRFRARGGFAPALRSPRKFRGDATLLHAIAGRTGVSRLGVALTRRVAPSAVLRNRLKRMVRELFRRHPVKHAGLDLVIAFRDSARATPASLLAAEVRRLLDQALDRPGR